MLLLLELFAKKGDDPINLILLRWYDEWPPKGEEYDEIDDERQELYGCP